MKTQSPKTELRELILLGQRFASRQMHKEALALLRLGLQLDPGNEDLQTSLKEVLQRASPEEREPVGPTPSAPKAKQFRRDTIDAAHFIGLANFYLARGDDDLALECAEMARSKAPYLPTPYKLHGRVLARQKDFDGAAEQFTKALRFDPFDRQVAEALGRVEYERQNYRAALAATIDAFLLQQQGDRDAVSRLKRRIRTLKQILGWQNPEMVSLFRDRQEQLTLGFDRLRWRRERLLEEKNIEKGIRFGTPTFDTGGTRIALAGHLRKIKLWSRLSDEALFILTQAVQEEFREPGSVIFVRGTDGRDLFILNRGEVVLQRPTPYGTFPLRILKDGDLFGEVNYVLPAGRSGDALTVRSSHLLRFKAEKLGKLIERVPELGVELYSSFWHGLAHKLRHTNERMKTFFPSDSVDALPQNLVPMGAPPSTSEYSIRVDPQDKIRLFREQGLSGKELLTLATFSKEKRIEAGKHLFHEGDPGNEMYVIADGQVRISKFIPGAGEEALAILGRGDFFGEIALIEGQDRSADAQAHGGPVTVLALDQSMVKEVLTMDPQASLEFLKLLCRLLAKRLREIDGKIVAWQILSGQRSGDTEFKSLDDLPRE